MTAYDSEYMKEKKTFRDEIFDAVNELKELSLPKKLSSFVQALLSDVDGKHRPPVRELLQHEWVSDGLMNSKVERRLSSKSSPSLSRLRLDSTSSNAGGGSPHSPGFR